MWFINNAINGIIAIGIIVFVVTIIELKFDFPWEPFILVVVLVFLTISGILNLKKTLLWVLGCTICTVLAQLIMFDNWQLEILIANISLGLLVSAYLSICYFINKRYWAFKENKKL